MDEFLKSLKAKEQELVAELSQSSVYRQLESLRDTIATFEGSGIKPSVNGHSTSIVPSADVYDSNNFTWRERVLFAVKKRGSAGIADIISEIQLQEPNQYTKQFLDKRVGVTVSQIKRKGDFGVKKVNKKNKYFIK